MEYSLTISREYPFQISLKKGEEVIETTLPVMYGWSDKTVRDLLKRINVVEQIKVLLKIAQDDKDATLVLTPPDLLEIIEQSETRQMKKDKKKAKSS